MHVIKFIVTVKNYGNFLKLKIMDNDIDHHSNVDYTYDIVN